MILGIGVDMVDIERFIDWDERKLRRIVSEEEVAYCLQNPKKQAERIAVRFAAREALFKALSAAWPEHSVPLLTLCKAVKVKPLHNGLPCLVVDWAQLVGYLKAPALAIRVHLSLAHTDTVATAFVIIEQ